MTNHFHLIVEIPSENLSAGMHRLNGVYAQWFNERHDRTGHLFERRFSAKRIEGDEQLQNTAEYVLQNPVKAGLMLESVRLALARRKTPGRRPAGAHRVTSDVSHVAMSGARHRTWRLRQRNMPAMAVVSGSAGNRGRPGSWPGRASGT